MDLVLEVARPLVLEDETDISALWNVVVDMSEAALRVPGWNLAFCLSLFTIVVGIIGPAGVLLLL
jgi:hypothetical protein